jgi:hypothetical protein
MLWAWTRNAAVGFHEKSGDGFGWASSATLLSRHDEPDDEQYDQPGRERAQALRCAQRQGDPHFG